MFQDNWEFLFHVKIKTGEAELQKGSFYLQVMPSLVLFYQKILHAIFPSVKANETIIQRSSAILFPQIFLSFTVQPEE